jgi:integrase/recombinase XerD
MARPGDPVRRLAGRAAARRDRGAQVGDLHQNRGCDLLRVSRKGGRRDARAINPRTALHHNGKRRDERRGMDPDVIDRLLRKYAGELGLGHGYSTHSMRATFITTALENGAPLEDVQKAAGHRDPGSTKLYDRRGTIRRKRRRFLPFFETRPSQCEPSGEQLRLSGM